MMVGLYQRRRSRIKKRDADQADTECALHAISVASVVGFRIDSPKQCKQLGEFKRELNRRIPRLGRHRLQIVVVERSLAPRLPFRHITPYRNDGSVAGGSPFAGRWMAKRQRFRKGGKPHPFQPESQTPGSSFVLGDGMAEG